MISGMGTDISDQVVLVTGGTKGIGRGVVRAMLLAGARVAFSGRDAEECAHLAAALNGELCGGAERALGVRCELHDRASLSALVDATMARWRKIDTLVCNAADIGPHTNPEYVDAGLFARLLEANVANNLHLCQAVLPQMGARGSGSVILITSIVAHNAMPTNIAYAASKAAVTSMARSLAAHYATRGVRVNCVSPGLIRTEGSRDLWENEPLVRSYVSEKIPMQRIGEAEEIGAACLFLASPHASYITAATIPVDGGRLGIGQMVGSAALIAKED